MGGKWFSKIHNIPYLTWEEEQIIAGSILGDGYLEVSREGRSNARFREIHTLKQKDYLLWKCERLKRLGARYSERLRAEGYVSTQLTTPYLPILGTYRDSFYSEGHKVIKDKALTTYAHHLALAIWFMDDGTLNKKRRGKHRTIRLMTENFSYADNLTLLDFLGWRYGVGGWIESRIRGGEKAGTYFLCLSNEGSKRFASLIRPFIYPTMEYKVEGLQSMF